MKIGGPKGPGSIKLPETGQPRDVTAKDGPSRFDAVLSDKTSGVGPEAMRPPAGLDPARHPEIQKIVEQLRAGEITGQQGAEAIVRAVVKRRGAALEPELRQQLETSLTQMLAADPLLAARVRELGGTTSGDT
jgi:hypothetical protein